jgi:hypothetical protein
MKKPLILMSVLLFLIASAVHAQVTQANTQFPNPGFEKWTDHNCTTDQGTSEVPDNWHTFDEVKFDTWPGESTARKTSHFKLTGSAAHGGSGTALQVASHSALGVLANGTITSGRTRVGSLIVENYKNYNFSDLTGHSGPNNNTNYGNGHFYWNFIGCPDSMSFYYKTNWSDTNNKPLIKVYLHQGEWYDHANKVVNSSGNSSENDITHSNLIAYCQKPFYPSSTGWKRFTGKFIQYSNHSENTDNTYSTIVRPEYILASFSTNENAGGGSTSDKLTLDDLWCIYDKGLSSVAIGGTANSAALNTFNAAEYATHEPTRTYDANGNPSFNNSGSATWTYRIAIPCNNIPQVTATPKSKLVSEFTITQATAANGYKAHIYVKHNDNSTFDYYIQFTPASPTITLNNGGTYTACEGDSISVTASGANSYNWSNGLGSSATVYPTASGVYTVTGTASNGCTNTATATVTVNARPSVNITGPSSLCQGTIGTLTATGSFISCTWDDNSTNATRNITPMNAGTATYSVTVTGSNSCTNSTSTTVNVMANPSITTVSANTPCTGDDLILNAETETESAIFAWSGPNDFASNEQNPTIGNASTTMNGDYTVTVTDQTTECSTSDTVTVTVNARPSVNITGPSSLCQGTTGTLTATGSFVSCTWDDDSTNATRDITPMNAGPATYSVTVTDSNSCTNSTSTTVNVMANPSITTVSANTPCTGYDLILNAETETEGEIFAWSGPNDFTSNEQNPTIGNASTTMNGDYTVTVTDTATECSAAASVTVTVNQPTTNDTTATACESFDWYNHSNITESCSNLTHTLAGANINGCDSIVTLLLTINYGTHNTETDSAYESFTWHDTTYSTSGTYTYEYINADGCASTDTLHLTINQGTQDTETVIALNNGTNWVSFNVEITLNDLKAALVEAAPSTTIKIIGQSNYTTYNPNNHRWSGTLSWDLSKMYKIQVTTDCEISLEGTPIDPADHTVTIVSGNNYLGFPFSQNMTLTNAFAGFAANGDKVLSQTGYATYNRGRWQGTTLTQLQPGKGYIYKSAASESRPFVFPNSAR